MALKITLRSLLASELRRKGTQRCIDHAVTLENDHSDLIAIHLRDLELRPKDLKSILNCISQADFQSQDNIKSISFSYNRLLGDLGADVFSKNLNLGVREVGLVACNIQDEGGYKILEWINATPTLRMICIEQNQFSYQLQHEFRRLRKNRPDLRIIF